MRSQRAKEKKKILVTGATRGIGRETARQLAKRGDQVILAVRDGVRGKHVVEEVLKECPDADIVLGPTLDLASCQSIRSFAKAYMDGPYPLHVLVNNAALGAKAPKSITPEGVVNLVQVNFLGPFLLTWLLKEKLKRSSPSRVVNVSSIMHRFSDYDDPEKFMTSYDKATYKNTKFANVLFTSTLQSLWGKYGIESVAVDPGAVSSGIWRYSVFSNPPFIWALKLLFASCSDGAAAVVHACTVDFAADGAQQSKIRRKAFKQYQSREAKYSESGPLAIDEFPSFRYYARGAFSWPTLQAFPSSSKMQALSNGFQRKLTDFFLSPVALVHAAIDWPLRCLSLSLLNSRTQPVMANLSCYDVAKASKLWNCAAKKLSLPHDA